MTCPFILVLSIPGLRRHALEVLVTQLKMNPFPVSCGVLFHLSLVAGLQLLAGISGLAADGAHGGAPAASHGAAGWVVLFDGRSLEGWRGFKKNEAPKQGWMVEDGVLKKKKGVSGGDLITTRTFGDFELEWDWRLERGGNNGVKYFITEERDNAIGHEYQMIDDEGYAGGKLAPKHTTASFYDVLPPSAPKPLKPAGEWNHSRIRVQGNQVEHWLNGAKVLSYEAGSPAVMAAVQKSKFKGVKGFGTAMRGHILLTDHRDECWFRQIRIRELTGP